MVVEEEEEEDADTLSLFHSKWKKEAFIPSPSNKAGVTMAMAVRYPSIHGIDCEPSSSLHA